MFVTGTLQNTTKQFIAIRIPKSAVLWTGKRSVVYVKNSANEPIFEAREITLGAATNEHYEVLSGLSKDDEIVTNGAFTVDAAAQLQGKKSMMNTPKHTTTQANATKQMKFDAKFEKAFQPSISAYVALKDAFVKSDAALTAEKSEAFRNALDQLNKSQRETLNMYWATLHKTSKSINKNAAIELQRKSFQIISNHMIAIIESFETLDQKLTVQFCPMADDNKGAYWLSTEEIIRNPYFGDAMLTCGSVTKVLE